MDKNDLISRSALKDAFWADADNTLQYINSAEYELITLEVDEAPAIDPVHAAGACYCGECRYCVHQPGLPKAEWICVEEHNYCECGAKIVNPNHFCGYGVKKEG